MASPGSGRATTPALPSPPFIRVPGLDNLRDAGGHALASNPRRAVRRGLLFRSADWTELDDEALATLQRLGIAHVFDLRSVAELAKGGKPPPRIWEGATRVFAPVFLDTDYSPESIAVRFRHYSDGPEGFVKAYAAILEKAAEPGHPYAPFRMVLEHLATPEPPTPILVHCSAGKDRTGVLIALILALCGVDDDTIANEYNLTELGFAPRREKTVRQIMQVEALFGDRQRAERMVSAEKETMLLTLAFIREKYGSVESYVVNQLGVSPESIDRIRKNLVVDLATVEGEGRVPVEDKRHHTALRMSGEAHL